MFHSFVGVHSFPTGFRLLVYTLRRLITVLVRTMVQLVGGLAEEFCTLEGP